jgi:large subunit ribosomal protein L22
MEATAHLRFARISVRKARVILNLVRGQNVAEALDQLRFTRKAAAPIVGKLIDSAIANAQQRDKELKLDRMYVKRAWADKAPGRFMVRWRPRAQGRATQVQKGVTHITVVVDERETKPGTGATRAAVSESTPNAAAGSGATPAEKVEKKTAKKAPKAESAKSEPVKPGAKGKSKGQGRGAEKDKA